MSPTFDDWKARIPELSPAERAELAYQLLHSLDGEADADWDDRWSEELQRRTEAVEGGQAAEVRADQALAELRQKYS